LVGATVNVTDAPPQIVVVDAEILETGVNAGLTVI
jgi:hypothetical protein